MPEDKPVVLLGRDTWPLMPLLRARGVQAQYFLWSRLNGEDPQTYKQWLKEVPPNSVVIDSGFSGSVIDKIRNKDNIATGLLMSSSDPQKYEQILVGGNSRERTLALEKLVKLTSRSRTYSEHGGAVLQDVQDDHDTPVARKNTTFSGVNRWTAEAQNRDVLRAAGLPSWDVWRYSSYVGLTPQERLGLNSRSEVETHYRSIAALRGRTSKPFAEISN